MDALTSANLTDDGRGTFCKTQGYITQLPIYNTRQSPPSADSRKASPTSHLLVHHRHAVGISLGGQEPPAPCTATATFGQRWGGGQNGRGCTMARPKSANLHLGNLGFFWGRSGDSLGVHVRHPVGDPRRHQEDVAYWYHKGHFDVTKKVVIRCE